MGKRRLDSAVISFASDSIKPMGSRSSWISQRSRVISKHAIKVDADVAADDGDDERELL